MASLTQIFDASRQTRGRQGLAIAMFLLCCACALRILLLAVWVSVGSAMPLTTDHAASSRFWQYSISSRPDRHVGNALFRSRCLA